MIDSNQWLLLQATYGKAMLLTHVIEQRVALRVAMWGSLKTGFDDTVFQQKLSSLRKLPFGKILKAGVSSGALSKEDGEALNSYRKLRNILVHDISDSISFRLLTKSDSANVIAELNEIWRDFNELSNDLMKSLHLLFLAAGGDLKEVEAKLGRLVAELSKLDVLVVPNNGLERDG